MQSQSADGSAGKRDDESITRLVVAIPTFKRAERLAELLPMAGEQLAALRASGLLTDAAIFVIDNDAAASARSTVAPAYSGIPTGYFVEETPGIPAVRNRALRESTAFELLAFIDDDEVPLQGWIESLVHTWQSTGRPAAVMGRVVSIFADDVDPWVTASGLFERPQRLTGTEISVAATGNLLLDLVQVRRFGVWFDESIGLGGGSDTLFSKALKRSGARLVWCDESVAEDTVEIERQTRAWVLKRAHSHGNVAVMVRLKLERSAGRRAVIRVRGFVGGVARMIVGYARSAFGWVFHSLRHRSRGRKLASRGTGMISASIGRSYSAYSRPPSAAGAA